jgi:phosphomannomutase
MSQSPVNPDIFKAYDIRGLFPQDITAQTAHAIGVALANLIQNETGKTNPKLVVSKDMRLSGPELHQAVIDGITAAGADVLDIDLASTPTFYFAVGYLGADGGVQVSASHNPSEWNGFKMVRAKAKPISGDSGIYAIRDAITQDKLMTSDTKGSITPKTGLLEALLHEQTKDLDLASIKPFKIVLDPANAMGILDLDALFSKVSATLTKMNYTLDGTFPSHEADPLKSENMEQLKAKVLETGADLGITTDGDGDRVFLVDNKGETLPPELLRGILAQIVLQRFPGSLIGYDIRPGRITRDMIEEAGGKSFVTRVGHSLIKEKMLELDSPFSGESSGHFFYKSQFGSFEMPVRMLADFLIWLSRHDQPLSDITKPFKRYFHSGEINSVVVDKDKVFEALKTQFSDALNFSDIDGVTFEFSDFWFNVRGSNTEPKMRLNLEATSQAIMEQKRDEVLAIIRNEK